MQKLIEQQKDEKEKRDPPVLKCREGGVELAVWKNTTPEGYESFAATVQFSYKDKAGKWQQMRSVPRREWPVLAQLLGEAFVKTRRGDAEARETPVGIEE